MTDNPFKGLAALSRSQSASVVAITIAIIGSVDFLTGIEYRVGPLYYLPVSLAAWQLGKQWGLAAATVATAIWFAANFFGGLHFSSDGVWIFNSAMQLTSFSAVSLVIAALRSSVAREQQLSRTDPLTSLLNGRGLAEEATRILALCRRHGHAVTLAYVDLDNFKTVNDTLGHYKGDQLLCRAAEVLRRTLRTGDIPARMGGDEFVALLPETDPAGARRLLERLRAALSEVLTRGPCPVTTSVGAVSFLEPPRELSELVLRADALMYSAKLAGKDRMHLVVVGPQEDVTVSMSERPSGGFPIQGERVG